MAHRNVSATSLLSFLIETMKGGKSSLDLDLRPARSVTYLSYSFFIHRMGLIIKITITIYGLPVPPNIPELYPDFIGYYSAHVL